MGNTGTLLANINLKTVNSGKVLVNGNEIWTAGNDGAGSGLDADTVDGYHASSLIRIGESLFASGNSDDTSRKLRFEGETYIIKNSSSHSLLGRQGYGWHMPTAESFHVFSSGWVPLFGIEGGTGNAELKGQLVSNGTVYGKATASTFDVGGDTTTNAAFAFDTATRIVGVNGSYIRTMFAWTSGSDIEIGQGTTSLIGGINLLPGSSGLAKVNGNEIWTTGNDGAGSGLDADLLDGIDSSRVVYGSNSNKTTNTSTYNSALASGFYDGSNATGTPTATWYTLINTRHNNDTNNYGSQIAASFYSNADFYMRTISDGTYQPWSRIWNEANDGAGSGLDADLLDGLNSEANAATSSTIAARNGSGDIFARLIRSTYATGTGTPAATADVCFRNDSSSDNYIRTCTRTAFASYLAGEAFTWTASQTFNDNYRVRLGSGNDTQIWHNGSNTYIDHYTGNIYIRDNTTTRFTFFRGSGTFTATGNITAYSDVTLKNIIAPIDRPSLIDDLVVYDFEWKDGRGLSIGGSAQEMQKSAPELIETGEDGILSVDYGKYALAALYEEKKKREALEERVNKLEALVQTLLDRV